GRYATEPGPLQGDGTPGPPLHQPRLRAGVGGDLGGAVVLGARRPAERGMVDAGVPPPPCGRAWQRTGQGLGRSALPLRRLVRWVTASQSEGGTHRDCLPAAEGCVAARPT